MDPIDHIQFVRHSVSLVRRHYVDENDVRVVLSRLPGELWSRLRKVHFKDDAKGNRRYGYTTRRGRREVSLCALPHQVTIRTRILGSEEFGAVRGSPWPSLAVRRYLLYNTLLHELGHLQIILPKSVNPNRKFASETLAQEFADTWRRQLWSQPFDHSDPVHNPPSKAELQALKAGWIAANLAYKQGHGLCKAKKYKESLGFIKQSVSLYPDHALALERLGQLHYFHKRSLGINEDCPELSTREAIKALRRAIALDPTLPFANFILALAHASLKEEDESRRFFERAIDLDPCPPLAKTFLADAISYWGHVLEAGNLFKRLLKAHPDDNLILYYYARHLLYWAEDTPANDQRTAELLRRTVKLDPKDNSRHFHLAVALSRLPGHTEEAIRHVREALRLNPERRQAQELLDELTSEAEPQSAPGE